MGQALTEPLLTNEASVITLNRLGLISPSYTEIRTFLPASHDGDWQTREPEDQVQVYGDLLAVVFKGLWRRTMVKAVEAKMSSSY